MTKMKNIKKSRENLTKPAASHLNNFIIAGRAAILIDKTIAVLIIDLFAELLQFGFKTGINKIGL